MRKLILVLVLTPLFGIGCDSVDSQGPGNSPGQIEGKAVETEKNVRQIADKADSEDCQTYFAEVAQACHDSFYEGLDISCHTAFVSAQVAQAQMEGELFKDPSGKVSATEIGTANCAANVKSLRKKRDKAVVEAKKDWGPQCTEFFQRLESSCVAPIARAEFGESCSVVLMMTGNIKRNQSPEDMCQSFAQLIRD
jgi:hypothetical protein